MASETSLRILILGNPGVGKSALAVRYLTKRYLGEYISNTDVMYRCMVDAENTRWKLEILDSSNNDTQHWLHMVRKIKAEVPAPVILLGNKGDLEDFRQVCVTAGAKTATQFACLFSELSAAESAQPVIVAFESLIREAQLHQYYYPKIFARCKRPNIITVTKLIIALFGKSPKVKRRRPFLSL